MIGVITVVARLVGFDRHVLFAHTVGTTCLGTAYTTANMVPNIIYDIVLGGALSSVVVPVLAGPVLAGPVLTRPGLTRPRLAGPGPAGPGPADAGLEAGLGEAVGETRAGGTDTARQIASALLTWTVLLLVPVSAALALAAHPIVSALLSGSAGCPRGPLLRVGA